MSSTAGLSLTREEAKLLANFYHGLINDLPRGNNCKAKFKKPKIRCNNLTPTERIRERHLMIRLQLHGAIYRPDSFVLMLHYCANLKAIRYESTSLNRIVADKSHRVIVA